ncbi:LytTR family DNA-binding domain-containing protein [Fusibacter bizertensis]|uniref:Stage 0 sporulation protein A homolog n=1 Tax=Fusibacter bizertensis TaxID=1488331 RepID=A0ABT6NF76_9FIRM|nr:LytTR family DNA-binding domain-containing protein [Fusibacter bizertensis]MDH8679083.1 LytTR family DNA-binding domain-containing protein [Fusibacter bizertensis]
MFKIAICDDEVKEVEYAYGMLNDYSESYPEYNIKLFAFSSPLELLTYVSENGGFDLVLLDIYMTGMLGTDAARELRSLGDKCEIIFLTSSRDHAIEAFELDAVQYILKPFNETTLKTNLDKLFSRLNINNRQIITMKTSKGIFRLAPRNVIFTETGKNNYQIIHTIQGEKLEVRMTASELYELLSQNKYFIKCGASINVNLKYVRQITKDTIIFDSGESINYPYRIYPKLKEQFMSFQMNEDDLKVMQFPQK